MSVATAVASLPLKLVCLVYVMPSFCGGHLGVVHPWYRLTTAIPVFTAIADCVCTE